MKYEDLKCEFCNGNGETEHYVEPYGDSPVTCDFCNGTGIDQEQLNTLAISISGGRSISEVCDRENRLDQALCECLDFLEKEGYSEDDDHTSPYNRGRKSLSY